MSFIILRSKFKMHSQVNYFFIAGVCSVVLGAHARLGWLTCVMYVIGYQSISELNVSRQHGFGLFAMKE